MDKCLSAKFIALFALAAILASCGEDNLKRSLESAVTPGSLQACDEDFRKVFDEVERSQKRYYEAYQEQSNSGLLNRNESGVKTARNQYDKACIALSYFAGVKCMHQTKVLSTGQFAEKCASIRWIVAAEERESARGM